MVKKTIQTRVMDEFGSPIFNAHVFTSPSNGATTNSNGYAELTGNAYDNVTVSYVGKTPIRFTLQNTPREVVLFESFESLDEVVVMAPRKPTVKTDPSLPKYLIPAIGGVALLMILMSASSSSPEKVTL